ncbi:MAG TPA: Rap1a/Tai family immunity protein [Ktedonobacterales bacterium]|nr:Rap1a/Tai family immunity protein [Ktedonobacterales bacterium]
MRWLALIAVTTAALAAPAAAEAPSKTGYTLELWCMSDHEEDVVACWHYLVGVGDGLTAARAFGKSTLCIDTTRPVPPEQLRRAFLQWAAEHPEFRQRPAANDAVAALLAAFPCSQ